MALLILGLVLFLGVHSTRIFADGWRTSMIARLGPLQWKGLYALVSIIGFVVLIYGYKLARQETMVLWTSPWWMKHVTALLMMFAFILFVSAYVPRNSFKARLHHPQVLSVKVWALAHLLATGIAAGVVLFGGFLIWAVLSFRRRASATGRPARCTRLGMRSGLRSRLPPVWWHGRCSRCCCTGR